MSTNEIASSGLQQEVSVVKRTAVLLFGLGSYLIGVTGLVVWILHMLGVIPFMGLGIGLSFSAGVALNITMVLAFAVQHTIMARPGFKEKWGQVVPPAAERATFVLATGLILGPMTMLWHPVDTVVWSVANPAIWWALMGVAVFGFTYLFLSTWAINHFQLFGLRQVWQYFRGDEVTDVPFRSRLMYRFDRHPIMTGILLGMWVTPEMHIDQLLFAATVTVYIVIGVSLEERSLRERWGATYDDYANKVWSIVPTFRL